MKKVLFFLLIIAIQYRAIAQPGSLAPTVITSEELHKHLAHEADSRAAAKTTGSSLSRWYSYSKVMDGVAANNRLLGGDYYVRSHALPLWNDTNGSIITTAGLRRNNMVSIGSILAAQYYHFNYCDSFFGEMVLGYANAHVLDSIQILGYYGCNPAKPTEVDTLRLVFLYGIYGAYADTNNIWAATTAHSHYGKISSPDLSYDTLYNRGRAKIKAQYQDVLLYNTDSGLFTKKIPLTAPDGVTPAPIYLSAGSTVGMTISFKSGDTAATISGPLSTPVPGDTLITDAPPYYKYNMFMPYVDYYTETPPGGSIAAPAYPFYSTGDRNAGCFKTLPDTAAGWGSKYIPHWAFQDTLPSYLQYPLVNWHIECATCLTVGIYGCIQRTVLVVNAETTINIYPNPATDELYVDYSLPVSSDVAVTLLNVMGQVAAATNIYAVRDGHIKLNTAELAPGMYIYKVRANGELTTGRVLIEH